jgi:hypothetical protein
MTMWERKWQGKWPDPLGSHFNRTAVAQGRA